MKKSLMACCFLAAVGTASAMLNLDPFLLGHTNYDARVTISLKEYI
jgi:hypothetical protein